MKPLFKLPIVLYNSTKSKSSLYNDINEGLFVPPVNTGARSVAWPSNEVESLINAQIAGKSPEEIKLLVKVLLEQRKEIESIVDAQIAGKAPKEVKQLAKAPAKKNDKSGAA